MLVFTGGKKSITTVTLCIGDIRSLKAQSMPKTRFSNRLHAAFYTYRVLGFRDFYHTSFSFFIQVYGHSCSRGPREKTDALYHCSLQVAGITSRSTRVRRENFLIISRIFSSFSIHKRTGDVSSVFSPTVRAGRNAIIFAVKRTGRSIIITCNNKYEYSRYPNSTVKFNPAVREEKCTTDENHYRPLKMLTR